MTSLSSPNSLTYNAIEEDDTQRLGLELGRAALPGLVIGLNGDLGAGKTRLVRAVVEGLDGSPRDVSSPTFVLLQHYPARLDVHHADAYRLKSSVEFLDLGAEEWIGDTGVALVEWAERVADALPTDRLDIQITVTSVGTANTAIKNSRMVRPLETRAINIPTKGDQAIHQPQ